MKMQEFAKLCILLFDNRFNDCVFMETLALNLNFENAEELKFFVNMDRLNENFRRGSRGRPLYIVTRQKCYDFWKANSEISNDRRNACHMVKIKPSKLGRAVTDVIDTNITDFVAKGGSKLKAQKHAYCAGIVQRVLQKACRHQCLYFFLLSVQTVLCYTSNIP